MWTFRSFEDIEAWQKARRIFGLPDQLRRSSVSIMANIAEGFERSGTRELIQFLSQAKGSAGELRSHIVVTCDLGYLDQQSFYTLNDGAAEIARMGLIQYLRKSTIRGSKFSTIRRRTNS